MFSPLHLERIRILGAVVLLAGCGAGDENRNPVVAAKVNDAEISVDQLRRLLDADAQGEAGRDAQVLERLIDQELIVQRARQRHLERDPEVARELEAARREILVRAYLARVVGPASPPTEEAIRAFHTANPALFSERRIYELRQVAVRLGREPFEALQAEVRAARSLDEVLGWLKAQGVAFQVTDTVRAAEQLPIDSLEGFARMQRGQMALSPTPGGALLVQLVNARRAPLDLAAAQPLIEDYLRNDSMAEAARAELARLRGSARIVYGARLVGEAQGAHDTPAADEGPNVSTGSTLVTSEPIKAAFERGVAGLR